MFLFIKKHNFMLICKNNIHNICYLLIVFIINPFFIIIFLFFIKIKKIITDCLKLLFLTHVFLYSDTRYRRYQVSTD
jgi:hypothetical protein